MPGKPSVHVVSSDKSARKSFLALLKIQKACEEIKIRDRNIVIGEVPYQQKTWAKFVTKPDILIYIVGSELPPLTLPDELNNDVKQKWIIQVGADPQTCPVWKGFEIYPRVVTTEHEAKAILDEIISRLSAVKKPEPFYTAASPLLEEAFIKKPETSCCIIA